jgi:two-component system, NtrC family, response regulator HydG
MTSQCRILVVDDGQGERQSMARLLTQESYRVNTADSPSDAMQFIEQPIDIVISDLRMGEQSGMDLLRMWKERKATTPFIILTGHGDVSTAVEAMKLGAHDYLTKPVNPDELLLQVSRCLDFSRKEVTLRDLHRRLDDRLGFDKIIGKSDVLQDVIDQARLAANAECTVLITGESGTGKQLIAEALHHNGVRKNGPFVTVNMAAVPEGLVESELFGHVKGAFTGAMAQRIGRFEAAHGGTLFIDEIGDFAQGSQAKLLRVLENSLITPVGGNTEKQVDVRVVAATSRNLEEMIGNNQFREDLYYRLNVVTIHISPLRERPEDIILLAAHFLDLLARDHNKPDLKLDDDLISFLQAYSWPGNIRQLRNAIENMVVLSTSERLSVGSLPLQIAAAPLSNHPSATAGPYSLVELERTAVEKALAESKGHRAQAASALGISVRTLQRKLKLWNLE